VKAFDKKCTFDQRDLEQKGEERKILIEGIVSYNVLNMKGLRNFIWSFICHSKQKHEIHISFIILCCLIFTLKRQDNQILISSYFKERSQIVYYCIELNVSTNVPYWKGSLKRVVQISTLISQVVISDALMSFTT
jgi:hypothetical protein